MFKLVQMSGFLVLLLLGISAEAESIHCGSKDYRYNTCQTSVYTRHVVLKRQLSKSRCDYGTSWGYNSDSIWVDKGCEAIFETIESGGGGGGSHNNEEQINCGSEDYRYNSCNVSIPGKIIYVQLVRQLSKSACVQGQSYGVSYDSIWVDKGCEGVFRVITHNHR